MEPGVRAQDRHRPPHRPAPRTVLEHALLGTQGDSDDDGDDDDDNDDDDDDDATDLGGAAARHGAQAAGV